VWFPDPVWMIWTEKLPLATGQQTQSLDPESIILFCLKEDCNNKNMFVSLTHTERKFVFQNKNMLYCHFDKIYSSGFIIPAWCFSNQLHFDLQVKD
jgi:hypothetical protein